MLLIQTFVLLIRTLRMKMTIPLKMISPPKMIFLTMTSSLKIPSPLGMIFASNAWVVQRVQRVAMLRRRLA